MKTCQEIIAVTLKREETLEELIKVQDQVFKLRNSIHKKRVAAQIVEEAASTVSVTQKPKPKPKPRRAPSGRRKSEEAGWLDITDLPYQFPSIPSSQRYFCYPPSLLPNASHQDVCFRRRKGRGGRILVDRCHFSFQQKQESVDYHVNPGWVEDNFPASDEFNAISLRYASQLLTEQDQVKLQPSLFPGSLHHSDNPPLPHGLLEGKLAAALTARMNCSADIVSETEANHNPPLEAPANTDIHVPSSDH
ncbi:Enhancer of polycomb-like protein 1 [Entomophthora muscae]|uniref:Enhancer of polycomb-like protein 1 n=1 Tax=Entomophthora muscae TaxID=34485 RepID=A0ACC2T512_9FUNG|nr:Enhancer of polycomb-like protein 1 [Entomophthora muscae]